MLSERNRDTVAKEAEALLRLRKEYGMRDAGAGKFDSFCPAHDDQHGKSLRVYRAEDGRLYFRCYAGCTFNDVRRALGLPVWHPGSGRRIQNQPIMQRAARDDRERRYNFAHLAEMLACDGGELTPLSAKLCVSVAALLDGGVGFADRYPMYVASRNEELPVTAWVWPMVNVLLEPCGLRTRYMNDDKGSWTDSTPGLFVGRRWLPDDSPVLVVEGATERDAGYDFGFNTIGKPSCNDGDELVLSLLRGMPRSHRHDVVIGAQVDVAKYRNDGTRFYPGQESAKKLADYLLTAGGDAVRSVKIVTPPSGFKDFRQWLASGATAAHMRRAIDARNWHRANKRNAFNERCAR